MKVIKKSYLLYCLLLGILEVKDSLSMQAVPTANDYKQMQEQIKADIDYKNYKKELIDELTKNNTISASLTLLNLSNYLNALKPDISLVKNPELAKKPDLLRYYLLSAYTIDL